MWCYISLVPRPSPHPVFLLLAVTMQKQRGKVWSILSCEDISGRQRWGGVSDQKNEFRTCVLHFEPATVPFLLRERSTLQCLGQKQEDKASSLFFRWETFSPPSTHYRHSRDKMDQAFPSVFAYCSPIATAVSSCKRQFHTSILQLPLLF